MPSLFLMIIAKDLEPDRVSAALGLRPWQSWRKGETKGVTLRSGRSLRFRSLYKWGGWKFHLGSPNTEKALIRKMTDFAKKLTARKTPLRALVRSGHEVYLVSLIQDTSSLVIPPELHGLLAGLGVHLQIDFWPSAKK